MKAAEWIDKAAEKMGGASDYALAKRMRLTRGGISSYRRGRTHMDDDACIAVAEILDIDPIKVIADQQAERAKTDRARAFWKRTAAKAVVIVATATGVATLPAQWLTRLLRPLQTIHYAHSRVRQG
ncbi:MAG: hypothetical protein IPF57_13655 [Gammaproteobacteria bacterium]|nr:hypothetical protein [Gammaproteobacteria bacterium]